jgi:hypothetical protein
VNPATSNSLAKGSGITSPADGIPEGDNFDIDYVAHEVGHQLGANHTFSMSLEGSGVNKEVGSGITIMGYAGITAQDVAPHSIDIFHQASIAQIQANLATKTCPASISITANNAAPVLAAVNNYTIPISTPFALTASASDANGDALTYCWEQNDNSTTSGTGSVASPGKLTGPNWLSFIPTATGTRLFPKLSTILAGLNVTPTQGGDAGANTEALSSVSRTLNFRVTVRDNHPYVTGQSIGQTAFTDAVVTVTNTSGPFQVTSPNSNITWSGGGSATVTWSVNGTNAGSVNCQAVNILLSSDGGLTFPTVLASSTANDGSETITVPSQSGTTYRVKVESVGNIFFDISNTNFTIGAAAACSSATGLTTTGITGTTATVSWGAVGGATGYEVGYQVAPAGTWTTTSLGATTTSLDLTGLAEGTAYNWRVRVTCANGTGDYSQSQFTTVGGPVATCPGTYDLGNNNSTGTAAGPIPFNTDVLGRLEVKGDNDYYKFTISTGGTITISLTSLPADYQLALLSSTGAVLQTSANAGTASESINASVAAGNYFVRVYPRNNGAFNGSSCYNLRVQTGTASRNAAVPFVNNKLGVSPNPAGYVVSLSFNADVAGSATVTVLDQAGSTVLSRSFAVNEGNNTRKLDIGNLAKGMYFVRIQSGSVTQMAKLVIAK